MRGRGRLRRGAVAAALTSLLLLGLTGATSVSASCAGDYAAQLRQVAAGLRTGTSALTAAEELNAIALSDGAAPALDPLIVALQNGDVVAVERRLESLAATLQPRRAGDCAAPYDAGARGKLAGVYRSPAFANLDHPPPPSWVQRLLDAIGNFLRGLSGRLGLPLTIALGAGLLALVAGLAIWRLGRVVGLRREPQPGAEMAEPAAPQPDVEWRSALQAAARGDFREAVRRAFRSALLSLSGRGRLAVDPAWTTRELLARAGGDLELLGPLAAAAGGFDIAWYSGGRVTDADWEAVRAHCRRVRVLAGDRSAEP